MPSFLDIASKPVEAIERPPLPPIGTYRWSITKLPERTESADKKWEFLRVFCRAIEPLDNVDMTDYKGDPAGILMSVSFVFNTEDEAAFDMTLFRMRQFFEKHVGCVEKDATIAQMLNASVNGQFLGDVVWKQDKRDESGETMQAEIGRTAPVE